MLRTVDVVVLIDVERSVIFDGFVYKKIFDENLFEKLILMNYFIYKYVCNNARSHYFSDIQSGRDSLQHRWGEISSKHSACNDSCGPDQGICPEYND